jgi:hypothetical protein
MQACNLSFLLESDESEIETRLGSRYQRPDWNLDIKNRVLEETLERPL